MNKKWYIVYQMTNIVNNKIYIGVHKTKNPEIFDGYIGGGMYFNSPSSYSKPNSPYQYAVKKYGPSNFKRTTLKIFNTAEEAYKLESEIVDKNFIKRKDVYNAQLGGFSGGFKLNPTFQFDESGKLVKEWDTIMEASEFYGLSHTAIINAIKFKGSSNGYFWSHENNIDTTEYTMNKGTTCYVYLAESGKFYARYSSVPETASDLELRTQDIQRALKGGYKVKNYYFSTSLLEEFAGKPKVSIKNKIVYVYDLDGNLVFESKNSKELMNYLRIKTTNPITIALRMERPYKQWQFSLEKVEKMPKVINKRNISKKVGRYTMNKELLETYNSITEAVKLYGTGVQRVLKGQQSHCKGFLFDFITD